MRAPEMLTKGGLVSEPLWVAGKGLRIGRGSASKNKGTIHGVFEVFVDSHQGKHVIGPWWDYSGMRGDQFRSDLVSNRKYDFLSVIAFCIDYNKVFKTPTGKDLFFSFPFNVDSGNSTPYVHVQASFDEKKFFGFHCYPDPAIANKSPKDPDLVTMTRAGYQRNVELGQASTKTKRL